MTGQDHASPADGGTGDGRPGLTGRALVTGGTSGLGLEFARALASRGAPLVLVARDPERLDRTAEQLRWRFGVEVETLRADVGDPQDLARVVTRLTDRQTPVHTLVNNAGFGLHVPLTAEDTEPHQRGLDVMVRAVLELGAAAGRTMRTRGHGTIVNVGSVSGLVPMGSYSAIKSWVNTYAESLAIELAGTGVRVTGLLPGWVRTEFHGRAGVRTSPIPSFLWLDAVRVVDECLADVERGRVRSIPSRRYRLVAFLAIHGWRPAVRRVTARIRKSRS